MLFATDMTQLALVSRKAAAFAREHDMPSLECGRYDLGDGDFVNVMEYTPAPRAEKSYESHVDYVDIQTVLRGHEFIEVAPASTLTVTSPYDTEGDYALYDGSVAGERFLLEPGRFCLVLPPDAHMPGIACDSAGPSDDDSANDGLTVKKAVFKIRVDHLEPTR